MSIPTVPPSPLSGLLRIFANASLAYPLVLIALLYADSFLAWHMLGHQPVAWTDDPKSIVGSSWLHLITQLGAIGILPAVIASAVLNLAYIFRDRPSAPQAGIRVFTITAFWLGLFVWLKNDPHRFLEWWLD